MPAHSCDVEEHRLLGRRQRRGADALGLNHPPVLPGPEHEIRHARPENRLPALRGVQRVDQREGPVVLAAERPNLAALERVRRRLRGGQAWRHARPAAGEGQVDRQMMAAELYHPRRGRGRRADEREVILVFAEHHAAAARPAARTPRSSTRPSIACVRSQHLVAANDLHHFPIPIGAQRGLKKLHRGGALRRRQIPEPKSLPLEDPGGEIGPARLLGAVEGKLNLPRPASSSADWSACAEAAMPAVAAAGSPEGARVPAARCAPPRAEIARTAPSARIIGARTRMAMIDAPPARSRPPSSGGMPRAP